MSSHTQLAVVSLQAGMLRFSMWTLQEMSSGSLTSSFPLQPQPETGQSSHKGGFQASACITFVNGPLAKTRHISKLGFQESREDITSWWEERWRDITKEHGRDASSHRHKEPSMGTSASTYRKRNVHHCSGSCPVPRENNPASAPGKEFSFSGFTLHLKGCQEPKQSPEAEGLPLSLRWAARSPSWHIFPLCVCSILLSANCFISLYFWHLLPHSFCWPQASTYGTLSPSGPAVNQHNLSVFPMFQFQKVSPWLAGSHPQSGPHWGGQVNLWIGCLELRCPRLIQSPGEEWKHYCRSTCESEKKIQLCPNHQNLWMWLFGKKGLCINRYGWDKIILDYSNRS